MSTRLEAILRIVEDLIPPALAEEWDNVGLQIGDPRWRVKKIWVALDPSADVVQAAAERGVDLLITHHPLLFKPLKRIDLQTSQGAILQTALANRLAIYAAHTNYDRSADGLNDILARKIGLLRLRPLEAAGEKEAPLTSLHGLGRVGELKRKMSLRRFADHLKARLSLQHLRVVGRLTLPVKTVALCTGSGSSLLDHFLASGAQVYLSGDLRYHDARIAEDAGLGLIDIGHFHSEHLMAGALADRLAAAMEKHGLDVAVRACTLEKDPFKIL
jgi:dinuclear metal center YbgI/SA1388 family protein